MHPVVEVKVKPGDRVKGGQVLVKLDDDEPRADVRAKKAAVEIGRINLREDRRFLIGAEAAYRKGAFPEKSLHDARNAVLKGEQDQKAALAMLASSQAELEHYTVTAPIDGVVTWLTVVPGMVSRPGTTVWGEILNLDVIDVQCEVAAAQADHISVGQTAKVWREQFPDGHWAGEVIFVGVAADERTGLVPVRLHVKDSGERLRCNVEVKVRFGAETGVPAVAAPKIGR
jgi:membrane fusion protein (multidrug efflux system)